MTQATTSLFKNMRFYQKNRPHCMISRSYTDVIFHVGAVLLAQAKYGDSLQGTSLIQQDPCDSCIGRKATHLYTPTAYSPYGFCIADDEVRLNFAGNLRERVSHGYMLGNGHRLYSPTLMRFSSADSWSPFGKGGINTYAYCAGEPVNRADPSGRAFTISGFKKWLDPKKVTGLTALLDAKSIPRAVAKRKLAAAPNNQQEFFLVNSDNVIYRLTRRKGRFSLEVAGTISATQEASAFVQKYENTAIKAGRLDGTERKIKAHMTNKVRMPDEIIEFHNAAAEAMDNLFSQSMHLRSATGSHPLTVETGH